MTVLERIEALATEWDRVSADAGFALRRGPGTMSEDEWARTQTIWALSCDHAKALRRALSEETSVAAPAPSPSTEERCPDCGGEWSKPSDEGTSGHSCAPRAPVDAPATEEPCADCGHPRGLHPFAGGVTPRWMWACDHSDCGCREFRPRAPVDAKTGRTT